ncbi:hypothetical protein HDE_11408 [Halotydeus destructor]|nr:hypothetical protein HDE_11408 [Halotydeus destructor]
MVSLYKRRSEPHIPDLSDAPSDELSDQFPASNLTAEFYAPNYHHLLGTSSSPPSSSSSNILSPSSSSSATNNPGWFSINDDSYKNYCSIRDHYATVGDRLTSGFSRELHRPLGCPVDLYPRPQPCCCVTHHNSNQMSQLHFAE